MMYLLAILLPPVAVLLCGKPIQALINFVLTLFFWVPGVVHAIMVVYNRDEDRRVARIEKAIRESSGGKQ
jgi:uncharacterized membrane protein YqaE (UPF0057 family)